MVCQKLCQNSVSGWGSLEESNCSFFGCSQTSWENSKGRGLQDHLLHSEFATHGIYLQYLIISDFPDCTEWNSMNLEFSVDFECASRLLVLGSLKLRIRRFIHTHTHTHIYMYVYIHIHIHIHIHLHIHIKYVNI